MKENNIILDNAEIMEIKLSSSFLLESEELKKILSSILKTSKGLSRN